MQIKRTEYKSLISILKEFDENGRFAERGKWKIANGGYCQSWELYYDNIPVIDCDIYGGLKIKATYVLENKCEEIIKLICSVYDNCRHEAA